MTCLREKAEGVTASLRECASYLNVCKSREVKRMRKIKSGSVLDILL